MPTSLDDALSIRLETGAAERWRASAELDEIAKWATGVCEEVFGIGNCVVVCLPDKAAWRQDRRRVVALALLTEATLDTR